MKYWICALLLSMGFSAKAAEEPKLRMSHQLAVKDKSKHERQFIQLSYHLPKRKAQTINLKALQSMRLKKIKIMKAQKVSKKR